MYLNKNDGLGGFAPPIDLSGGGPYFTGGVAVGDLNGDGTLDLVFGNGAGPSQIYLNRLTGGDRLPNNPPAVAVSRPGVTDNANFFSSAEILSDPVIPIPYHLFDAEGEAVGCVAAYYSLDGGGRWQPAVAASGTLTTNLATSPYPTPTLTNTHIYAWDVFASGVFGQSDNVVFRLEAYPQPAQGSGSSYSYPHSAAGPYQRPYAAATPFPFRVRGTQVLVLDEAGQPAPRAVVYRRPDSQPMGGAETPFRTSAQGYLGGRGELKNGDELVALWPINQTAKYTLYQTSATPTDTGLTAFTVTQPGVQTLTVSVANPLLLFDLDVSLEWNAGKDPAFLIQLEQNLGKTSAALYDWTNGQVALGRVTVYQDREQWDEADVRIFASNQIRPVANQGGIVRTTTVLTHPNFTAPLTATRGEIRIGPTWNRYGDPQPLGDDWPRVLAHEIGHYALFLEDTYLGLDEVSGLLVPVDTCTGTAMSDPYDDVSSELRFDPVAWQTECSPQATPPSLAELPDWEMLTLAYPDLHPPLSTNSGPATMPFAFTEVKIIPSAPDSSLLDDFEIDLPDNLVPGRAYLRQPERLIDLGGPALNAVLARGARPGDELCVFASSPTTSSPLPKFACAALSNSGPPTLNPQDAWQPEITLTPINSTTLQILVTGTDDGPLTATLYLNGQAPQPEPLTSGVTKTVTLNQPAVEVLLDIVGDEAGERLITGYVTGAGPGKTKGHGGPGKTKGHGGPFASGDGGVLLYPPEGLSDDIFMTLQNATVLPELPPGLTAIGRAYHVRPSAAGVDFSGGSLTFQYLGLEVLLSGQPEESLTVHFWDGATWIRLETVPNLTQNFASAPLPGPGLYALLAGQVQPTLTAVSPLAGRQGLSHTLTISGLNFLSPVTVRLKGQTGQSYPLTVTGVKPQTVTAVTPSDLPVDLYDLELINGGGLSATQAGAFALYKPLTGSCFFDDFASGLGQWMVSGEWGVVTLTNGEEAVTDSPTFPYLDANPNETRTTSLTSASFSLDTCPAPLLTFRHDYRLDGNAAGQFQDNVQVELSVDEGQSWQPLASYMAEGPSSTLSLASSEWSQVNWQGVALNLPPTATTARLRFSLVVDDSGPEWGWLIDDVTVCPAPGCLVKDANFIYLPLVVK